MDDYKKIKSLLDNDKEEIPRAQVLGWIKSNDLNILGILYELTDKAYNRIEPELGMDVTCDFILHYLKRCILENPSSKDSLFTGYEAAWEMTNWIKHLWSKKPDTDNILRKVIIELKNLYIHGNKDVKDRIVNGTLEHIFEEKEAVSLFQEWEHDPSLKQAYDHAIQWGREHWKRP